MEQQRNPAPGFYKIVAVAFAIVSVVLFWFAATRHEWMFWAMAIITLVNAIMSFLKSLVPGGRKTNG